MKASIKGLRVSTRKLNPVTALVRGRSVNDALTILDHTPRRAADSLKGAIKSAAANAEHNDKIDPEELIIETITIGTGGMLKRYRPNARGTIRQQRHRFSNVHIVLRQAGKSSQAKSRGENADAK